jgi:hypothetical protein
VPAAKNGLKWRVAAGVLTLALLASLWAIWRARQVEMTLRPLVQLDLDLGPEASVGSSIGPSVILSPDGKRIVFVLQAAD